jgi:hypothetical protein
MSCWHPKRKTWRPDPKRLRCYPGPCEVCGPGLTPPSCQSQRKLDESSSLRISQSFLGASRPKIGVGPIGHRSATTDLMNANALEFCHRPHQAAACSWGSPLQCENNSVETATSDTVRTDAGRGPPDQKPHRDDASGARSYWTCPRIPRKNCWDAGSFSHRLPLMSRLPSSLSSNTRSDGTSLPASRTRSGTIASA